ncbi:MAG TPA: DUF4231 domain-containing protein [Candidatus Limnocylindria bacterium]|nr:DUF4231 domain-containing protein [Candidatus Limnocylindria bacterium]
MTTDRPTPADAAAASSDEFPYDGYPALFRAADRASMNGQRAYIRFVRVELLLLLFGAALGSLAAFNEGVERALPIFASLSFFAAAILRVASRDRRYDKQWFDGRAVAETVKTTTWRYMMRVPPFDEDATADQTLAERLRDTLGAGVDLHATVAGGPGGTRQISPEMRTAREDSVRRRRDRYRRQRLTNQMDWYRQKSLFHRGRAGRYFMASLVTEITALAVAGLALVVPDLARLNLLALLAAAATAATAISQLNRHDELSKSYGLASQELSLIDGIAERADTEAELAKAVDQAEGAISREHTMWVAKVVEEGHRAF